MQKLKQELETLRQEFFQFQMRADAEKKSVEHKLAKAKQDISTIQVHSKSQSQRVQALQDSVQVYFESIICHECVTTMCQGLICSSGSKRDCL